jgi:hypothetical protein
MKLFAYAVASLVMIGCGDRLVGSADESAETARDNGTETSLTSDSGFTTSTSTPKPEPDSASVPDPEPDSGTETEDTDVGTSTGREPEAGSDSDVTDGCVPIEAARVAHDAFYGRGCFGALQENVVLTSQEEVDAHTAAFCDACPAWSSDDCPDAPELPPDSMIIYAWTSTTSHPAHLEIHAVQDCGDTLVVDALATAGLAQAVDRAWDSVTVPASDKPVAFDIDRSDAG